MWETCMELRTLGFHLALAPVVVAIWGGGVAVNHLMKDLFLSVFSPLDHSVKQIK